jgi:hypothetical protein
MPENPSNVPVKTSNAPRRSRAMNGSPLASSAAKSIACLTTSIAARGAFPSGAR